MEHLLIAIITTGAHQALQRMTEAASSVYYCSQMFIDLCQAYEEKAIRRLKENFAEK